LYQLALSELAFPIPFHGEDRGSIPRGDAKDFSGHSEFSAFLQENCPALERGIAPDRSDGFAHAQRSVALANVRY
jgi:hypothetical protein